MGGGAGGRRGRLCKVVISTPTLFYLLHNEWKLEGEVPQDFPSPRPATPPPLHRSATVDLQSSLHFSTFNDYEYSLFQDVGFIESKTYVNAILYCKTIVLVFAILIMPKKAK